MANHRYTPEQIEFLKAIVPGQTIKAATVLFNNRFGMSLPLSSVMSTCYRYGIKNGRDTKFNNGYDPTQFKKGHVPVNKGTKGVMKPNRTSFVKGNRPKNYKPIGTERLNRDGYYEVKIADPAKWKAKHVIIWEEHNGPVPKGHAVMFGDRNKTNLDINNLLLVSRRELAILNKRGLISNDVDLTKTGIAIADIYLKISERKNNKKSASAATDTDASRE